MTTDDRSSAPDTPFRVWSNPPRGNQTKDAGAVLKDGPSALKTVQLRHFAGPDGALRKRELRFRTHSAHEMPDVMSPAGGPPAKDTWYCQDEEIDRLIAFMSSTNVQTGRYEVLDSQSPAAALLKQLTTLGASVQDLAKALLQREDAQQLLSSLANDDRGLSAAQSAIAGRRLALLAELRDLIDNNNSTETQAQQLIGSAYWIFGGRYVGVAARRSFAPLDQHDIPLLGADGTLHLIELKGPSVDRLIVRHRSHWIVGHAVHEAVAQAMNYLRTLDEGGLGLSKMYENELGQKYDMSRVFATVVVGHSEKRLPPEAESATVRRTLRQYNAHLSRIEVLTYDQLLANAERALTFEQ